MEVRIRGKDKKYIEVRSPNGVVLIKVTRGTPSVEIFQFI